MILSQSPYIQEMEPIDSTKLPIIRPIEAERSPRGISYQKGFQIIGTPLGFGNNRDSKLRFISSIEDPPPRKNERILMHRSLVPAIGCQGKSIDVLAIDYEHKIKLGRIEIELFSSGMGIGAAQLRITHQNRRIVYCGGIRSAKPLFSPPITIPECELLLLDFANSASAPPAPSRAGKELVELSKTLTSKLFAVISTSCSAALEALWNLRAEEFPIYAEKRLYDMFRRLPDLFGQRRKLFRLTTKLPNCGSVMMMKDKWVNTKFAELFTPSNIIFVGEESSAPNQVKTVLRLGEVEDVLGTISYIKQTGTKQVVLGRNCTESLAERLLKTGIEVHRISHPVQIPLPFFSRRL